MRKSLLLALALALTLSCDGKDDGGASGTFKDSRDGKAYKWVKIGEQTWMAENLNYNAEGSKCYENKPENCQKYGRLYNRETAMKACPKGWHLPSDAAWDKLLGSSDPGGCFAHYNTTGNLKDGCQMPIEHLKSPYEYLKAKSGWDNYFEDELDDKGKSGNGLDTYGFSALPGGIGNSSDYFSGVGSEGKWWSTDTYYQQFTDGLQPQYRYIGIGSHGYYRTQTFYGLDDLLSVRCIKDN
jgi:uncharacterized protein (TIGR02145 family)